MPLDPKFSNIYKTCSWDKMKTINEQWAQDHRVKISRVIDVYVQLFLNDKAEFVKERQKYNLRPLTSLIA